MPTENNFTKANWNPFCPNPACWSAPDIQAAEHEVSLFAGALVRLIKPKVVIETGCYGGDTSTEIALAIKDNGFGKFSTCDIEKRCAEHVAGRLSKIDPTADIFLMRGADLLKQITDPIDFAFIDSGDNSRQEEMAILIPKMSRFGMILLHDTAPQFKFINQLANEISLPKVYFNTPRGLTLFLKI